MEDLKASTSLMTVSGTNHKPDIGRSSGVEGIKATSSVMTGPVGRRKPPAEDTKAPAGIVADPGPIRGPPGFSSPDNSENPKGAIQKQLLTVGDIEAEYGIPRGSLNMGRSGYGPYTLLRFLRIGRRLSLSSGRP